MNKRVLLCALAACVLAGCGSGAAPPTTEKSTVVAIETPAPKTTTITIQPEAQCKQFRTKVEEMAAASTELSELQGQIGLLAAEVQQNAAVLPSENTRTDLDAQVVDLQRKLAGSLDRVSKAAAAVASPAPEATCA